MLPYGSLSLCLIISSKNYIFYPKRLMKSSAVGFCRKISQGSNFKKDRQFNSKFPIAMWCCGCAASQTLLTHSLTPLYWIRWCYDQRIQHELPQFLLFHTRRKINFQSILFWGICKSKLYSLDIRTDIPILDSLLVYVH